ncbi:hypothetical protein Vi05172_g4998 [Venturia inaequalis]|nr:hypothetical protein Vi05172_g4998 [Venturia inaequalis]
MDSKIKTSRFYHQWAGHPIDDMSKFRSKAVSLRPSKPIIYLAGDSSLDNKYWVPVIGPHGEEPPVAVPRIYREVLQTPFPRPDVAFWLNHFLGDRGTALNLAVEATMLRQRDSDLLDHDKFIRDNIMSEDILIVSVGGNDVAMRPTFATLIRMLQLSWLTPFGSLVKGNAWCLDHFNRLFKDQVKDYVERMLGKQKPKAVIVCMIYHPLEAASTSNQTSWADLPLKVLGYNRNPARLQAAIKAMYENATSKLQIEGTEVFPCALYEVLDGKNAEDYTARVEPSSDGGKKMAMHLMKILEPLMKKGAGPDET